MRHALNCRWRRHRGPKIEDRRYRLAPGLNVVRSILDLQSTTLNLQTLILYFIVVRVIDNDVPRAGIEESLGQGPQGLEFDRDDSLGLGRNFDMEFLNRFARLVN